MSPADPRIRRLQDTALFGAISDEIVAFVLENAHRIDRSAGEIFVQEGERSASLFWLERGRVAIVQEQEGREVEIRRLDAGACFGEVAHLDFGPRSASVRALEDSRALEITGAVMREIAKRDLEQFALLNMNIGRELSRRLRNA